MISILMMTPGETARHLAKAARIKRLSLNMSQKTLALRSGVSYGAVKKFEQTGKISLGSLLRLALVLEALDDFKDLFKLPPPEAARTLDELLNVKTRKRGRQ